MGADSKIRNTSVDSLRGIAILMVILGHTITGCTVDFSDSIVFNVIWSLQMPLFFIISGYVTRYAGNVNSASELFRIVVKRTVTYLLPWFVWTFAIRGLIFGQTAFFDIKHLLWHMDAGYWFLVSLWMISIAFVLSHYVSSKITRVGSDSIKHLVVTAICFVAVFCLYAVVGLFAGVSFLGIKLTLYYMPFYLLGAFVGKLQGRFRGNWGKAVADAVVGIAVLVYIALILRFSMFELNESAAQIALRAGASLTGCIAVCGLVGKLFSDGKQCKVLAWVGAHSLELYLIHYLLLSPIKFQVLHEANTLEGFICVTVSFFITVVVSVIVTFLLNRNSILRMILFSKKRNKV